MLTARAHPIAMMSTSMGVNDIMPYWEYNFFTVEPTFTVTNWPATRGAMEAYTDLARAERGAMFSGWSISGDKLCGREGFHDNDSTVEHMANVAPAIEKIIASGATLVGIEVHGPAAGLDACASAFSDFGPRVERLEIISGCTSLVRPYAGMSRGQSHFSLAPRFKVSDWAAAQPLLDECVARCFNTGAAQHNGCIYFGWTREHGKEAGDTLVCRSAFTNPEGVATHIATVGDLYAKLLQGPAALETVRVHGPRTRLGEITALTDALYGECRPAYYAIDSGFQKYEITGYNLGMLDYNKFG